MIKLRYSLTEDKIGCADCTYDVTVTGDTERNCTKKLIRYLENKYEDKCSYTEQGNILTIDFKRNGGYLKIIHKIVE